MSFNANTGHVKSVLPVGEGFSSTLSGWAAVLLKVEVFVVVTGPPMTTENMVFGRL